MIQKYFLLISFILLTKSQTASPDQADKKTSISKLFELFKLLQNPGEIPGEGVECKNDDSCADGLTCRNEQCPVGKSSCERVNLPTRCYPTKFAKVGQKCDGADKIQCESGYKCFKPDFITCQAREDACMFSSGTCIKAIPGEGVEGVECKNHDNCAWGLECVFPPERAKIPDLPGTCRKGGQTCGGFTNEKCAAGLSCVHGGLAPVGVCRIISYEGQTCGGFTLGELVHVCEEGLECVSPPEKTQMPDASGTCQKPTSMSKT